MKYLDWSLSWSLTPWNYSSSLSSSLDVLLSWILPLGLLPYVYEKTPYRPLFIYLFCNTGILKLVIWTLDDSKMSIQIFHFYRVITFGDLLGSKHWLLLDMLFLEYEPPPGPMSHVGLSGLDNTSEILLRNLC